MTKLYKVLCAVLIVLILVEPVAAIDLDWLFGKRVPIKQLDTSMFPEASPISSIPHNNQPAPFFTEHKLRGLQSEPLQYEEPAYIIGVSPGTINAAGSKVDVYVKYWKPNSTYRFNMLYTYEGSQIEFSLPRISESVVDDETDEYYGCLDCKVRLPPQRLPGIPESSYLATVKGIQNHFGDITNMERNVYLSASDYYPIIDNFSLQTSQTRYLDVTFDVFNVGHTRTLVFQPVPRGQDTPDGGVIQTWKDGTMTNVSFSGADANASAFQLGEVKPLTCRITFSSPASRTTVINADRIVIPMRWQQSSDSFMYGLSVEIVKPVLPNDIELWVNKTEIDAGEYICLDTNLSNLYSGDIFDGYPIYITVHNDFHALDRIENVSGAAIPVMLPSDEYPTTWALQAVYDDGDLITSSEVVYVTVSEPRPPAPNTYLLGVDSYTDTNVTKIVGEQFYLYSKLYRSIDPTHPLRGLPANITILKPSGAVHEVLQYQTGIDPAYTFSVDTPLGVYKAYAHCVQEGYFDISSNLVTINLQGVAPDTLDLTVSPSELYSGGSIEVIPSLSNSQYPEITYPDVEVSFRNNRTSDVYTILTDEVSTLSAPQAVTAPVDVEFWVTTQTLTSPHRVVHILPQPTPVPTYFPTYPVPSQTPPGYSRNTTQTGGWLNFTLTVTQQDIQNLTAAIWGMGVITPQDFYKWMRGSAGQVNVTVSNSTLEQLQKEAEPEVDSPFKFIMDVSTAIVTTEDKFVGYVLALIRDNPYAKMWPSISDWFTHLIPGFLLNLVSLLVLLFAAIQIRKLFH